MLYISNLDLSINHKPILKNVSIHIKKGEITSIIGGSGSGKTSLFKTILRIQPKIASITGSISIANEDYRKYPKHKIQPVFQDPAVYFQQNWTIAKSLQEPLWIYKNVGYGIEYIQELLSEFTLSDKLLDKFPSQLSGGELQRMSIIRALLCKPEILLMDEPLSALDNQNRDLVVAIIQKLNKQKQLTIVFISHDILIARTISHKVFVMKDGTVIDSGEPNEVFHNPSNLYTKELVDSIDLSSIRN